jgi:Flp pilus assembly protein CpaB
MAVLAPRQRHSGGLSLIMLGIVLALATAILVLYVTNSRGGIGGGNGTNVVVAARDLPTGTVLTSSKDNVSSPSMRISDAFHVEQLPASAVPSNAYTYTSDDDLLKALNGQIVTQAFFSNDILRRNDSRVSMYPGGPPGSMANQNPTALPQGSVLYYLTLGSGMPSGPQAGDHVDILATECVNSPTAHDGCQVTQTTLQNLLIYAVPTNQTLIVVVSHQDALALKLLSETARLDLVLRKPGDTGSANTQAIDPIWIINHFGFTPAG